MTDQPEAAVQAVRYEISVLPTDHIHYLEYVVGVELRDHDRWAVTRGRRCLSTSGSWDWEPVSSDRDEAWCAVHRFGWEEAVRLAKGAAPAITVNGRSAAEMWGGRGGPGNRPKSCAPV